MKTQHVNGWAIAFVTLVLFSLLAVLTVDRIMRSSAVDKARSDAFGDARILAAGLESELEKFQLVPPVLAEDPDVIALLRGDRSKTPALDRRLETLSQQTGAAVIYLMNAQGQTLSSSNYRRPDNFVGSNYGFRPYFRKALTDGDATQFALGTVSRRPGLYIARRIGSPRNPQGVLALKVEFGQIEAGWRDSGKAIYVTDADGIALIASNPDWRFRATQALVSLDREENLRQFGVAEFRPLNLDGNILRDVAIPLDRGPYAVAPEGWTLHLLDDPSGRIAASVAGGRLAVGLATALLAMIGGAAFVSQRRRLAAREKDTDRRTGLLREQLSQANRLAVLGQIGAGISHEIRQPVAAIRIFADNGVKLIDTENYGRATANFEQIAQLADRIGTISGELLRFSRRGTRAPRAMPIGQVIDGALLLLNDRIARLGIDIILPDPAARAIQVLGEHVRLEQVLVNLLQNAIDASGAGGRIEIAIALMPATCRIAVIDNGPGLSDGVRDRLFKPFVTTKEDGLGLGLVISKEIMRVLGGELRAEPVEGGARFVMEVPLA
ncbi:sensor histidine kinase [Altererythrobacter aquiaggeris]|uniref:sensor histidine kinase n=1 Tax=Aestuarierythrobacter aquiaggeris TaxID=1898396 RepID=UPI003017AF10